MKTALPPPKNRTAEWKALPKATVGKDILELLSSSMYIDPLTIYREYVQNAVDAIDEARAGGVLRSENGHIAISINPATRSIRIQDDGIGVRRETFEAQLGTFGGSLKRGTDRRGFRGVGRLAGLGYCQQLTFRTRAVGDNHISEMRWDCRKIKALLHSSDKEWTLEQLLQEVVSVRVTLSDAGTPKSFFEVELNGVIRHRNDLLLNAHAIAEYLSEIAPVPFHPEFSYGEEIQKALGNRVAMGNVEIVISGRDQPVYRAYRNSITVDDAPYDSLFGLEIHEIPANDDRTAAVLWLLHHSYKGAVPNKRIRGFRVRCGNVQIGDNEIFAEYFPEPRFNSWTVGEIHVLDKRLMPNGRRDHFEAGVHFENLANHVVPHARRVASLCRKRSQERNRLDEFERLERLVQDKLGIVRQNLVGPDALSDLKAEAMAALARMVQIGSSSIFDEELGRSLLVRASTAEEAISTARGQTPDNLASLSRSERKAFQKIFGLIYECSTSQDSAKALIEKILKRI